MTWASALPQELANEPLVYVSAKATVESACEKLVSSGASFLAVLAEPDEGTPEPTACIGLFDFADINAFLLLAIGADKPSPDDSPNLQGIVNAVKRRQDIFVKEACNLSEKNPLVFLPSSPELKAVLEMFSGGTHRVLLRDATGKITNVISDRSLVTWISEHPQAYPGLESTLALPLQDVDIGLSKRVISLPSDAKVLDAMKTMHENGVSSIAVIDPEGSLLSAVSVTDIGRLVATSPDTSVINVSLSQFIAIIKLPQGSTDGEDLYPIFSVTPQATLARSIQLLLATNSHRLFISYTPSSPNLNSPSPSSVTLPNVARAASPAPPPPQLSHSTSSPDLSLSLSLSPGPGPNATSNVAAGAPAYGVISMVDILAVFARLAGVQDVDPNNMRRHRRRSSSALSGGSGSAMTNTNTPTPSPAVSRLRGYSASSDSRVA